jgi:hypothetical protein
MKKYLFALCLIFTISSYAQEADEINEDQATQPMQDSGAKISEEDGQKIMEKLQKGKAFQEEQQKYLEELDQE